MKVRVSAGTLAVLRLLNMRMTVMPTTAYLLQYSGEGCQAKCSFCPQSMNSHSRKELVSRIPWPVTELRELVQHLKHESSFQRICLQSVLKSSFEEELIESIQLIRSSGITTPISVGTTPVHLTILEALRRLKVDRIGVGLDAASEETFNLMKGPFRYRDFWDFIADSLDAFGPRRVIVHLIFGLGESEVEFARTMEKAYGMGADVALFPFTPVAGTPMQNVHQPEIGRYRLMQIVRQHLADGHRLEEIVEEGDMLSLKKSFKWADDSGSFLTSGCPGCNRPFYNERASKIYNYPSMSLLEADRKTVEEQIKDYLGDDSEH
ncbi:MAG: radical SAM protein [Nitrososphaeria archaeon]